MKYYITQAGREFLTEKSITAMQRAGEFSAKGEPLTPRAKQKQIRSHERADATLKKADDLHTKHFKAGLGPEFSRRKSSPSKSAREYITPGSQSHGESARTLRVPTPLKARKITHKKAAIVSRRGQHLEPEDRTPRTDAADAEVRAKAARPEKEKEADRREEEERDAVLGARYKENPKTRSGRKEWLYRANRREVERRAAKRREGGKG